MNFWTSYPRESSANLAESLSSSPSGGRVKMWLMGVGLALVPICYGVRCLQTGQARLYGGRRSYLDLDGSAATALAIAYIAVGVFIHAQWFWGLHPKLVGLSPLLKILAVLVFLGGFGYAIYQVVSE